MLWRDSSVAVLVTREQRGVNHLLVLPQKHYPTILEVPDSNAADLLIAVRDAALAISLTTEPKGIAVWQNNGVPAHQAIAHLHFHVAGTLPGGGTDLGVVSELPLSSTSLIASKLAPNVPPRPGRRIEA